MVRNNNLVWLVVVLLVGVGIWMYGDYRFESKIDEMDQRYKKLEQEKRILELELEEQMEITDSLDSISTALVEDWEIRRGVIEQELKDKYEKRRSIIASQPIDSTVSSLSRWLKDF